MNDVEVSMGLAHTQGRRLLRFTIRDDSPLMSEIEEHYGDNPKFSFRTIRQTPEDRKIGRRVILLTPSPEGNTLGLYDPPGGDHLYATAAWAIGPTLPWLLGVRKATSKAQFVGFDAATEGMLFHVPERKARKKTKATHGVKVTNGHRGSEMVGRLVPRMPFPGEPGEAPTKETVEMEQEFTMVRRDDKETSGCHRYKVDGGFQGVTDLYLKKVETDGKPPARIQVTITALS